MLSSLPLLALAGAATAQIRGFNYGAMYANYAARMLPDWEADFKAAQKLPGTTGFTSARLFSMIQAYTTSDVTSALPAAAATNTSLLLGLWCSGGDAAFKNELTALGNAIEQYGDQLKGSILGISIGSEDLYRISSTGVENDSGPGAEPQQLVSYISQAKAVLKGTAWADIKIGHVDTWTAYVNSSNNAVIEALDWVGVDAYPYFQTTDQNSAQDAGDLFFAAYDATVGAAMGKDVWVTETGWPVTGPSSGLATSGTKEAETYWKAVACKLLGKTNTFWYQLNDGGSSNSSYNSFAVIPADRSDPLYDLSCDGANTTRPSTSASGSSSAKKPSATGAGGSSAGSSNNDAQNVARPNAGFSGSNSTSSGSSSGQSGQTAGGNTTTSGNSTYAAPTSTSSNGPAFTGGASAMVGSATTAIILAAGAAVAFL